MVFIVYPFRFVCLAVLYVFLLSCVCFFPESFYVSGFPLFEVFILSLLLIFFFFRVITIFFRFFFFFECVFLFLFIFFLAFVFYLTLICEYTCSDKVFFLERVWSLEEQYAVYRYYLGESLPFLEVEFRPARTMEEFKSDLISALVNSRDSVKKFRFPFLSYFSEGSSFFLFFDRIHIDVYFSSSTLLQYFFFNLVSPFFDLAFMTFVVAPFHRHKVKEALINMKIGELTEVFSEQAQILEAHSTFQGILEVFFRAAFF